MSASEVLLVPVQVDALAVGRGIVAQVRRPRVNLAATGADLMEPAPFGPPPDRDDLPALGVYLMWVLPSALTTSHQIQPNSPDQQFPLVPNRWLVLRRLTVDGKVTTVSWIVESDFADPATGTNPYFDPDLDNATMTRIGRKVQVSAEQPWEEPSPRPAFLRATAPADATFAAFQPSNENVFSLIDPLDGVDAGRVDYFVAGWYAHGKGDPFPATSDVQNLLDGLRWDDGYQAERKSGTPDTPVPSATLCHGMVLDVEWDRNGSPENDPLAKATPHLALGTSSQEALTALLRASGVADDRTCLLLEAILTQDTDTLLLPDGAALLRRNLHDAQFGLGDGGIHWRIADNPDAGKPDAGNVALTAEQAAAEALVLSDLNTAQSTLDQSRRELASRQRELYEMWWKQAYVQEVSLPPYDLTSDSFTAALDSLTNTVSTLREAVQGQESSLPAPTPDAPGLKPPEMYKPPKGDLLPTRQIVADLAPRFASPHDPVLLVGGLGTDAVTDPVAPVRCRYPDSVVTGFSVIQADHRTTVTVGELVDVPGSPVLDGGLPIAALIGEFEVLRALSVLAAENFDTLAAGVLPIADVHAAAGGDDYVQGQMPGIAVRAWIQAWRPLFLEWEVHWFGVPVTQWTFTGADYSLAEGATSNADQSPSGRTLLTPGLPYVVRRKLEDFVSAHADEKDVAGLLDLVQGATQWDFLSQTLEGLHVQLALRDIRATATPPQPYLGLVDGQGRAVPQSLQETVPGPGDPPPQSVFDGIRAGQFGLSKVAVVDRFGRTVELNQETIARTVISAEHKVLHKLDPSVQAELPPRILQGTRLRFEPVDDATANAICGFLVPHHLEAALVVYDSRGVLLGQLVCHSHNPCTWDQTALGSSATVAALKAIDPHLGEVLGHLEAAGQAAFDDFFTAIDEASWTIDPLAGTDDEYQRALLGRPLALVRASLHLEASGTPLGDPSWPFTFEDSPRTLLGTRTFPVQLGTPSDREDGLVGYLLDESPGVLRVSQLSPDLEHSQYVVASAPTDICLAVGADPVEVTLLVDPRAQVQAHTGILPTTKLTVAKHLISDAVKAMPTTFHVGPALADAIGGSPLLPSPRAIAQEWLWLDSDAGSAGRLPLERCDSAPHFTTSAPVAMTGQIAVVPERNTDEP